MVEMMVDLQAVRDRLEAGEARIGPPPAAPGSGVTAGAPPRTPPGTAESEEPPRSGELPSRARWKSPVLLAVLGAAVLVAASLLSYYLGAGRKQEPLSPVSGAGKKLAVLPFVNLSGDPEQECFCDGMTEQLITNLSCIPELKLIARASMMSYKNTSKDIRQKCYSPLYKPPQTKLKFAPHPSSSGDIRLAQDSSTVPT